MAFKIRIVVLESNVKASSRKVGQQSTEAETVCDAFEFDLKNRKDADDMLELLESAVEDEGFELFEFD